MKSFKISSKTALAFLILAIIQFAVVIKPITLFLLDALPITKDSLFIFEVITLPITVFALMLYLLQSWKWRRLSQTSFLIGYWLACILSLGIILTNTYLSRHDALSKAFQSFEFLKYIIDPLLIIGKAITSITSWHGFYWLYLSASFTLIVLFPLLTGLTFALITWIMTKIITNKNYFMNKPILMLTIISLLTLTSCTGIDTDLTYDESDQQTESNSNETNNDPIKEIADQVEFEKEANNPIKDIELLEDKQGNIPELIIENSIPQLFIDTFKYDEETSSYYGNLIATGYPTITEVQEPFCEENCDTYNYVYFNITSSDNIFLEEYLSGQTGNSFVGNMKIGIGCIDSNIISRSNDSDEFGMQEYQNTAEETELIMSATEDNPITLQLERYLYTGGHGAPACYSHFAQIRIIN